MESQPQNLEFRNNPENFHPCACCLCLVSKVAVKRSYIYFESKKEGKGQESIQPSTTPDPGYQLESDNVTIRHQKQEQGGQPFPSR